jgi:hypothetical protein
MRIDERAPNERPVFYVDTHNLMPSVEEESFAVFMLAIESVGTIPIEALDIKANLTSAQTENLARVLSMFRLDRGSQGIPAVAPTAIFSSPPRQDAYGRRIAQANLVMDPSVTQGRRKLLRAFTLIPLQAWVLRPNESTSYRTMHDNFIRWSAMPSSKPFDSMYAKPSPLGSSKDTVPSLDLTRMNHETATVMLRFARDSRIMCFPSQAEWIRQSLGPRTISSILVVSQPLRDVMAFFSEDRVIFACPPQDITPTFCYEFREVMTRFCTTMVHMILGFEFFEKGEGGHLREFARSRVHKLTIMGKVPENLTLDEMSQCQEIVLPANTRPQEARRFLDHADSVTVVQTDFNTTDPFLFNIERTDQGLPKVIVDRTMHDTTDLFSHETNIELRGIMESDARGNYTILKNHLISRDIIPAHYLGLTVASDESAEGEQDGE